MFLHTYELASVLQPLASAALWLTIARVAQPYGIKTAHSSPVCRSARAAAGRHSTSAARRRSAAEYSQTGRCRGALFHATPRPLRRVPEERVFPAALLRELDTLQERRPRVPLRGR